MGGADFVQWHGYYEIVSRLAEIKHMAAELRQKHAGGPSRPDKPEPKKPATPKAEFASPRRQSELLAAGKGAVDHAPTASHRPRRLLDPLALAELFLLGNISFPCGGRGDCPFGRLPLRIRRSGCRWPFRCWPRRCCLAAAILAGGVRPPLPPWANHPGRAVGVRRCDCLGRSA